MDTLNGRSKGYDKPGHSVQVQTLIVGVSNPASAVAQYFLGRALQNEKLADPFVLFPSENGPIGGIIAGYATALSDLAFLSFEYGNGFRNLKAAPQLPVETLLKAIEGKADEVAISGKATIDAHFAKE